MRVMESAVPERQGLYDPANEHDACGVGFVAHFKGQKSHSIVEQGLLILKNLDHRGAVGADPLQGDGAGILIQIPDQFYREEMAKLGVECRHWANTVSAWFSCRRRLLRATPASRKSSVPSRLKDR
jgi:glutamate synthase (NADPH/NADH) large chain